MPLTEFEIIKKYFTHQPINSSVVTAVGDDCAIVSAVAGKRLLMSMDTLVAGRHFPESATPYQIGTRALCTSLSDLAAMGARPLWFTLGLTIPSVSEDWLREFSRGLFSIATPFKLDLIGGDTTQGPLSITIQVHGEADAEDVLKRDGAEAGDKIFVTGNLGDGAAGLAILQNKIQRHQREKDYLIDRFYAPMPQIDAGQALRGLASSAIDISDGLLADAEHIAVASQVSLVINVEQLPIHPCLKSCDQQTYLSWALAGGDDYQLLFTVNNKQLSAVYSLIERGELHATEVGRVVNTEVGVECYLHGAAYTIEHKGYQHFAP